MALAYGPIDWGVDRGLGEILPTFCTNVVDHCLIGCHVFGSVICTSVVCPEIGIRCCPVCYVSDADRGLSEIPQSFFANGLVHLVIGSHISGSVCATGLDWSLIGLPVLGSDLSLCKLRCGSWT